MSREKSKLFKFRGSRTCDSTEKTGLDWLSIKTCKKYKIKKYLLHI